MSKAFTSESDDREDFFMPPPLPAGIKNYMTPAGAARLSDEIKQLQEEKKHLLLSDVEMRERAEKIDQRLSYLVQRFDAVEIINPEGQSKDRVRFGARVTLREAEGTFQTWRIVGIDEMNLDQGDISWTSPLAAALLDKEKGEHFLFMNRPLTIEKID